MQSSPVQFNLTLSHLRMSSGNLQEAAVSCSTCISAASATTENGNDDGSTGQLGLGAGGVGMPLPVTLLLCDLTGTTT